MLFNSYEFLIFFLPIFLVGFFFFGRRWPIVAAAWMAVVSLVFYGWWAPRFLLLIGFSIVFNYTVGMGLGGRWRLPDFVRRGWLLTFGIAVDLGLLTYFKYGTFIVANVDAICGLHIQWSVVLPIGISFYTFTQIAFLADAYRNVAKEFNFVHYTIFVTYFPHLIAGPILHHKDLMPQFRRREIYRPSAENLSIGLSFFAIGLFKKVVIADGLAPQVATYFSPAQTASLSFVVSWVAAIAYALQLYFDFSGYSDMAIGLSRLVGVDLPINFNSPYKSLDIIEFWRRWHMSLSRFLRDYLYIPLGGNRNGPVRRYANLMITMLLGGLWHGAGWTFVIWGGLHGLYLIFNHAWNAVTRRLKWRGFGGSVLGRGLSLLVTFAAVTVAWVFFRAPDLPTALHIIRGMAGLNGLGSVEVPPWFLGGMLRHVFPDSLVSEPNMRADITLVLKCLLLLLGCVLLPNSQDIMTHRGTGRLLWRPTWQWGLAMSLVLTIGVSLINRTTEFLYFEF